jgi:hypothetical protein
LTAADRKEYTAETEAGRRSSMAKDIVVSLENRPGTLATLGETLGNAGINIEGGCGTTEEGRGIAHLLVEDAAGARRALEGAGIKVEGESDVVVFEAQDRPGELGRIARKVADAGVNITLVYVAMGGRVVLGADDIGKARAAIGT